MGRVKISLIKDFLLLGISVVISDIDTAWIQNPLPYFNRFPQAHILTSTGKCKSKSPRVSVDLEGVSFRAGKSDWKVRDNLDACCRPIGLS